MCSVFCIIHIGMSTSDINPTAASLLGFLHWGPMTGWEIDRAVAQSISNFWNVTRSQVYRELRTLSRLGYVEAGERGSREKTPYTITPSGREAFAEWINRDPGPVIIRMPLLLTIFFAEHLPPGRLAEIAAWQREEHRQTLAELTQILKRQQDTAPFVAEVVRLGIGYNELMIRTLDRLVAGAVTASADPRDRSGSDGPSHSP